MSNLKRGVLVNLVRGIKKWGLEGIFHRYYSNYRGIVMETEDPEGLNRIQVIVPQLAGFRQNQIWAWPMGTGLAGKGYGVNMPVRKGDTVWVSFEFGSPNYPVYSFAHYGRGEKPEEFNSNNFGLKSRTGHLILIDEETNEITIKHKDGKKIVLSENSIQMNEGANGALINISDLVDKVNRVESRVKSHQHLYLPGPGPATPTTTDPTSNPTFINTTVADIADDDVTH